MNYSRQWRRTRTLSAITLHSSLPSVNNINVMAFIFSSRLRTRGAPLEPGLSLFLSANQCMIFGEKIHIVLGDQCLQWAFKNNCLKTFKEERFIVYFLIVRMWVFLVSHDWESEVLYHLWYLNWCPTSIKSKMTHYMWLLSTHLIPSGRALIDFR